MTRVHYVNISSTPLCAVNAPIGLLVSKSVNIDFFDSMVNMACSDCRRLVVFCLRCRCRDCGGGGGGDGALRVLIKRSCNIIYSAIARFRSRGCNQIRIKAPLEVSPCISGRSAHAA